ncbi:MAG: hypothetical protein Q9187_004320 [Circinaria calcarea]
MGPSISSDQLQLVTESEMEKGNGGRVIDVALSPSEKPTISSPCTGTTIAAPSTPVSTPDRTQLEDAEEGYPRVAAFLDSDASFTIYRRFGFLHARLLLYKQDELRELEDELREMDKRDWKDDSFQNCLRSRGKDDAPKNQHGRSSRKELLQRIEKKTLEYGELLRQSKELVSWNTPSTRDYTSVVNWLNTEAPLSEADCGFIKEKQDLITLRPGREHAWLDAFVERILKAFHCRLIQVGSSSSRRVMPKLI